jgi:hemerythrin
LLSLLNEFQAKRLAGADKAILHRKLEEVALYTRYHFCCEESLMAEISFPDLSAHTQRHQVLLDIWDLQLKRWIVAQRRSGKFSMRFSIADD